MPPPQNEIYGRTENRLFLRQDMTPTTLAFPSAQPEAEVRNFGRVAFCEGEPGRSKRVGRQDRLHGQHQKNRYHPEGYSQVAMTESPDRPRPTQEKHAEAVKYDPHKSNIVAAAEFANPGERFRLNGPPTR